jgi:hypothetical protein
MVALTASRRTPEREGTRFNFPAAAAAVIWKGGMVAINTAGDAVRASASATLRVVGVAQETVDNTVGAAGALRVPVKSGIFRFDNSTAGEAVTEANALGRPVYVVFDNQVSLTDNAGVRPVAGICVGVDDDGVWVALGVASDGGAGGLVAGLAAAPQSIVMTVQSNVSATAEVRRYVHVGPTRRITSLRSIISAALATGDMTITAAINGVAVTGGVLTVTQAGSAAGDIDLATPSAANTINEGDVLTLTVGGTNTGAGRTDVTVELS